MLMHFVILVMVSLFVVAGFWQLWRLEERRENNALVTSRHQMPPLTSLDRQQEGLEHRRARLSGRYDSREEVVLTGRASRGRSGNHILTPLRLPGDIAVIVDRGWVPVDTPPGAAAPPRGSVEVEGILLPSEGKGPFGGGSGETDRIARIDVERLQTQVPYELSAVYLLLSDQEPPPSEDIPVPGDLAKLHEGSHLTYAVQWFSFIPIALTVYAVLLRREARKRSTTIRQP